MTRPACPRCRRTHRRLVGNGYCSSACRKSDAVDNLPRWEETTLAAIARKYADADRLDANDQPDGARSLREAAARWQSQLDETGDNQ